ncbi:hypothetical protein PR202_gb08162 [Eleusine coracana subsp. coracana]|uniref:Protein kinase domain-containing protein n=1 Tax=Eleusine coracana subsp. coracana TaxID=191504 RepID=A0AAV5EE68_ELECO|nr:hypothetical protein PR202_gb08162 [Eleusine coracana subsp. coracana]
MGWTDTMMAALFGDGGSLGYLRLSKNNPSAASSVDPDALLDNSSSTEAEAAAVTVPEVTLQDLKKAARSLLEKKLIGKGRYANVSTASRLRHHNLVRLLGYNITADLRALLYEFASLGTLHDALHGPRGEAVPQGWPAVMMAPLSWTQRVQIALDAAKGLAYLHEAGVTHHDVRSTNVLLFQGFRA